MSKWQSHVELVSCPGVKFKVSRLVGLGMRQAKEKQLRRQTPQKRQLQSANVVKSLQTKVKDDQSR